MWKRREKYSFIALLIPLLSQEKITNVSMFDTISTHVKCIERNNIFGKVVTDVIIRTKLTIDCILRCQQISNLNIQFFPAFVAYKVNFLVSGFAYCNFIVPAQKFQIKDTFESISGSVHLAQWGDTVPGTLQRRMDK